MKGPKAPIPRSCVPVPVCTREKICNLINDYKLGCAKCAKKTNLTPINLDGFRFNSVDD